MAEPVQIPVEGKGIATNINRPRRLYFLTLTIFLLVRLSTQLAKGARSLVFLSRP